MPPSKYKLVNADGQFKKGEDDVDIKSGNILPQRKGFVLLVMGLVALLGLAVIAFVFLRDGENEVVVAMDSIQKPLSSISGIITFEDNAPNDFPPGSWLTVTLQDTSLADAPSIDIAKYEGEIKGFNKENSPLKYFIEMKDPPLSTDREYSVSAHISVGRKGKSFKSGDYLTTTMHPVSFDANKLYYKMDVSVQKI